MSIDRLCACQKNVPWVYALAAGVLGGAYVVNRYFRDATSVKTNLLSEKILKIAVSLDDIKVCYFKAPNQNVFYHQAYAYINQFDQRLLVRFPLGHRDREKNVSINCSNLEIVMLKDDQLDRVVLPKFMKHNLLRFLQRGRFHEDYCCFDFVASLYGNFTLVNRIHFVEWKADPYGDDSELKPGDAILLHTSAWDEAAECWDLGLIEAADKKHMAVYIGNGLYLSLLGTSGPLMFTNMIEMQKLYKTNKVLKLSPNFPLLEDELA